MKNLERLLLHTTGAKVGEFDDIFNRCDSSHRIYHSLISSASLPPHFPDPPSLVSLFRLRDLVPALFRNAVWTSRSSFPLPPPPSKNRGNSGQELNHSRARLIDVFASNGTAYSPTAVQRSARARWCASTEMGKLLRHLGTQSVLVRATCGNRAGNIARLA